jgi:hypothetical protein
LNRGSLRNGIVLVVLVAATAILLYILIQPAQPNTVAYSDFENNVKAGLVASVEREDTTLTVKTTDGKTYQVARER